MSNRCRQLRQRRCRAAGDGNRGTSIVEFVITMPALLAAILLIVQIGLWQYARHVALAAAQEGDRAARAYNGTANDGRQAAERYLAGLAPTLLQEPTVTADRSVSTATVRVRGRVRLILPGLAFTVSEESSGPVERFVPEPFGAGGAAGSDRAEGMSVR